VPAIRWGRALRLTLLWSGTLYLLAFGFRIYVRKYYVFLPEYVRYATAAVTSPAGPVMKGPTHVFVLLTDHFEPDWDTDRVNDWARRYAALAARHRDSAGRPPQHTLLLSR
jgi:hypothetical protein